MSVLEVTWVLYGSDTCLNTGTPPCVLMPAAFGRLLVSGCLAQLKESVTSSLFLVLPRFWGRLRIHFTFYQ